MNGDVVRRYGTAVAGIGIFFLVLYLFFPVDTIEQGLQNQLNDRLPRPVRLVETRLNGMGVESVLVATLKGERLTFPFQINVMPGWSTADLTLRSPFSRQGSNGDTLNIHYSGNYRMSSGTVEVRADSYPLSVVLDGQTVRLDLRARITLDGTPNGTFRFTVGEGEIVRSPVIPELAWGLSVNFLTGEGSIEGRTVSLDKTRLVGQDMTVTGNAQLTVARPLLNSSVRVQLSLEQPVQKQFQRSLRLREINMISGVWPVQDGPESPEFLLRNQELS